MDVAIAIEVVVAVVPFYCGVYICWQEIAFVCSHSIDTIAARNNLHFFMLLNFKLCLGSLPHTTKPHRYFGPLFI